MYENIPKYMTYTTKNAFKNMEQDLCNHKKQQQNTRMYNRM